MIVLTLLFFSPFIYLIVSCVVDSISDKVNEIKRKKYYGEEELVNFTTFNDSSVTNDDIILLFFSQFRKYWQLKYVLNYKIYTGRDEQNYAWSVKSTKQSYGWGNIYNIRFHFSNGWISISYSNKDFYSNGSISLPYYCEGRDFGTPCIENTMKMCKDEAKSMWKIYGKVPTEYLPFNYIPLSNENKSSEENKTQFELMSFYRNLLGLKLKFSYNELKKSYREAVGRYHPDRYSTSSLRDRENAEMLMKQVNEAYETLKGIAV